MKTILALVAAALAVAPAVASAQQPTTDTMGSKTDRAVEKIEQQGNKAVGATKDAWLVSKTKIALFADDRVSGRGITVDADHGVITLRGKVESAEAKAAAEQATTTVEGVTSVRNDLQVVATADRKAVDRKDDDIKKAVEDRISRDSRLKGADIDVRADNGIVTLTGSAKDLGARARASEIARGVDGVRAVKNEVEEKS
jgi:osmotically-inducible protein OsmY